MRKTNPRNLFITSLHFLFVGFFPVLIRIVLFTSCSFHIGGPYLAGWERIIAKVKCFCSILLVTLTSALQ